MSLTADDDSGPEAEPDYNEEEPPPDPSSGNKTLALRLTCETL